LAAALKAVRECVGNAPGNPLILFREMNTTGKQVHTSKKNHEGMLGGGGGLTLNRSPPCAYSIAIARCPGVRNTCDRVRMMRKPTLLCGA